MTFLIGLPMILFFILLLLWVFLDQ